MVTAQAAFQIIDRASDPMKKMRNVGVELDNTLQKTGKSLDAMDSPQVRTSLNNTERQTRGLGQTAKGTETAVTRMTTNSSRNFEQMAAKGGASIEALTTALKNFEKERATATLDVDIAKAEAKIRMLRAEIRAFSTAEARSELTDLGLIATQATDALGGAAGGGGGSPGGRGSGLAGGFVAAGGRAAFMATAVAAALPAIVALTGAVSALIGSLGAAVGGAGALGIGTIGAFAVGIGSIVSVVKPANEQIKEATKAQDAYNKAVQQYGRDSAQAAEAQSAFNRVLAQAPKGTAQLMDEQKAFSSRFRRATAPGRAQYVGLRRDAVRFASEQTPLFGGIANRSMAAARRGAGQLMETFGNREWQGIFRTMGQTFEKITGPGARAFGNIATWFGRIAQAASPVVVRMFESLEDWTGGLARGVSNRERTQKTVERLVGHLKDWVRMGGAAVKLMATFFGAGASQGQSIVQSLTEQFQEWTRWLEQHPGEVQDFFERTINSAGKLVKALGAIAEALGKIGDAMLPLLNLVSDLTTALGNGGMLEPLMLLGGGMFARRMFRGGRGGAGAAGAGAAGAGAGGGARGAYAASRAAGGTRMGSLGAGGMQALRGAGRFALPVTAAMAAFDFASYQGATPGARTQRALSRATFGAIPDHRSDEQRKSAGAKSARETQLGSMAPEWHKMPRGYEQTMKSIHRLENEITGAKKHQARLSGQDKKYMDGVVGELQHQLKIRREMVRTGDIKQAGSRFDNMIRGLEVRWQRSGSAAARRGLTSQIHRQIKGLGVDGKREFLTMTAAWTATLEGGSRKQRRIAATARREIVAQYRAMGKNVRVIEGQIVDVSSKNWGNIRKLITDEAHVANAEAQKAFTATQQVAAKSLRFMGYTPSQANKLVQMQEKPGSRKDKMAQDIITRGQGNVPTPYAPDVLGPKGDGIGESPFDKIGAGSRGSGPAMASGGGSLMGANPGLAVYANDASRFGLRVSSGRRPGSITSSGNRSHHASGSALDLAGPPAAMMSFARHAATTYGSKLEELIHTPLGFSIKNGQRVAPYAQADHQDHVHLADTNPDGGIGGAGIGGMVGAMPGMQQLKLKRQKSKTRGGVMGLATQRALDMMTNAMESRINEQLGGGAMPGGTAPNVGGAYNAQTAAQLWTAAGGNPGLAQLMGAIAMAESTGNPKAIGIPTSGGRARGLWQIMWPLHSRRFPGMDPFNPMDNARMAVAIHQSQGLGAWEAYTRGMHAKYMSGKGDGWGETSRAPDWGGWHARGGSFTVHRPTVIGVGEGGAERVTVGQTAANATVGGRPISITIGKIVNHEPGDIRKILERELAAVARGLNGGEDDELS